jgi:succinate dehydrogenase / fumarate reductase membrane anchor subunit
MRATRLWLWHLAAAAVIVALLGLHMLVMHLDSVLALAQIAPPEPLAWQQVIARAKSAFFTGGYVLLLGAALYHGLYGVHTMICELTPSPRARRTTTIVLWVGGATLFAVGTVALVAMHFIAAQPSPPAPLPVTGEGSVVVQTAVGHLHEGH